MTTRPGTIFGLLMVLALYGSGFFLPGFAVVHGSATGWQNALEFTPERLLGSLSGFLFIFLFYLSHLLFWVGVTLLAMGWRRASAATATVGLLAWLAWGAVFCGELNGVLMVLFQMPAVSAWLVSMGLLAALSIGPWFQSRKEEQYPQIRGPRVSASHFMFPLVIVVVFVAVVALLFVASLLQPHH
jgi:hypothetical protein